MHKRLPRIILLILFVFLFLIGLLCIYRATLKASDLTIVTGKVINKEITYSTSAKSGRHYYLAFQLANRQNKIALNLGTKHEAERDSAFNLIDTGKTYKFYLDPIVLTTNRVKCAIDRISYNGTTIYKASNSFNLYGGIFISLLSLTTIVVIVKYKRH